MVKKNKQLKSNPKKMRKLTGIDIGDLKKKARERLYNSNEIDEKLDPNKEDYEAYYTREYSKYIREEFNPKIVNMVIIFLNRSKNIPKQFKTEAGFIKKFISLVKYLLLSELEVVALTLLLDNLGWEYKNIEHWTYFCILGVYIKEKMKSDEEYNMLSYKISKSNTAFIDYYLEWITEVDKFYEIINLNTFNERYKILNRPVNTFCRKNFIDYNGVVDKIVKLSQPYGDKSNGNKIKINEEWEINPSSNQDNKIKQDNEANIIKNSSNLVSNNFDPFYFNFSNNLINKNVSNNLNLNINMQPSFVFNSVNRKDSGNLFQLRNIMIGPSKYNPMNFSRDINNNNNEENNLINFKGNNHLFM